MSNFAEYIIIYLFGAIAYSCIEIIWRGYTHWTMSLTGGFCFLSLYAVNLIFTNVPLFLRFIIGAVIITLIEFAVGYVVNIKLGWNVWDYSDMKINILGQISPIYSFLWFLLCFPGNYLCILFKDKIFIDL